MANLECDYGFKGLCAIRAVRLDGCVPQTGPTAGIVIGGGFMSGSITPNTAEAKRFTKDDSCGNTCWDIYDAQKGACSADVELVKCGAMNFNWHELFFGARQLVNAAGDVIGEEMPGCDTTVPDIYLELFTQAVSTRGGACLTADASQQQYFKFIFPRIRFQAPSWAFGEDPADMTMTGKALVNPNIPVGGPFGDYNWTPATISPDVPMLGPVLVSGLPTVAADCGYLAVA